MFHSQVKEEEALGLDHYLLVFLFSGGREGRVGNFLGNKPFRTFRLRINFFWWAKDCARFLLSKINIMNKNTFFRPRQSIPLILFSAVFALQEFVFKLPSPPSKK